MSEETLVYTVVEAGKLLGLTRNGSYEAVKKGSIPAIKIGKLIRVPKRALTPCWSGWASDRPV